MLQAYSCHVLHCLLRWGSIKATFEIFSKLYPVVIGNLKILVTVRKKILVVKNFGEFGKSSIIRQSVFRQFCFQIFLPCHWKWKLVSRPCYNIPPPMHRSSGAHQIHATGQLLITHNPVRFVNIHPISCKMDTCKQNKCHTSYIMYSCVQLRVSSAVHWKITVTHLRLRSSVTLEVAVTAA